MKVGNMKISLITILMSMILTAVSAYAASGDDILGIWYNQEKDARIQIFKCGEKCCGKVVWLKEPNYPAGSKEGTPGQPKVDHNNPDPALRTRTITGLQIMNDFVFAGDGLWKGGKLYDPETGKTYRGKMTLISADQLNLKGYIGIPLFGRTDTWTRYDALKTERSE